MTHSVHPRRPKPLVGLSPRHGAHFALWLALLSPAVAGAKGAEPRNGQLLKRVGAEKVPIEVACVAPPGAAAGQGCQRGALDRTLAKLAEAQAGKATVRVLHLGDSHNASDYITGTVRERLQAAYGDAGRGFVVVDQAWGYGGRRKEADGGWEKDRIVDKDRAGRPFGFSGFSLESKKKGARAHFVLQGDESRVRVYYQGQPEGGQAKVLVDKKEIGVLDTRADARASLIASFDVKPSGKGKAAAKKQRALTFEAQGPNVRIYGLSFETDRPGVFYDSIGPVGADAKVYLELDRSSFVEHLKLHKPDLVVLMVGGNDALKIRKSWTDLSRVKKDHEDLLDVVKGALPDADCLLWAPMDAGEKEGKQIVSRTFLTEVKDVQRQVALARGCAYWDLHKAMGGGGSIARWVQAKVMNEDLVHPREKAAELLGDLFFWSWSELSPAR